MRTLLNIMTARKLAVKFISAATLALLLTAGTVAAQTTTYSSTSSSTPGTPNTGSGGDVAMNIMLLGTSAIIAVGGALYLARRNAQ
jgi:hypothetical protein